MGDRQLRDPVHGFIRLTSKEADIVNTRIFQRLRGIRQLAFANLVYPGASHSRFDHSLGVFHVARLLTDALLGNTPDEETARLIRFAALLHDLGHGPFSHVSEDLLEICYYQDKPDSPLERTDEIHEKITQQLIKTNEELIQILGADDCAKIADLLSTGYEEPLLKDLVSGPLDADKQDYLLRDSFFCGVKYGVFDLYQLHRELRIVKDPAENSRQLGISEDGIHALEQFVLAKYHITNQVYRHRVRLITDQMFIRAIVLGCLKEQIDEIKHIYSYDGSEEFVNQYIKWDDAKLLLTFSEDRFQESSMCKLLTRLKTRRLFKQVFHANISEFPPQHRTVLNDVSKPKNQETRTELESAIHQVMCEVVPRIKQGVFDPNIPASESVILHSYFMKSVRVRDNEGAVLIQGAKAPTTFKKASPFFQSIDDRMNVAFVDVYSPLTNQETGIREKIWVALSDGIKEAVVNLLDAKGKENGDA